MPEIDKLLDLCNLLRVAGGAEPIERLEPGIRYKSSQCLVARSLNFDCSVGVTNHNYELTPAMYFNDLSDKGRLLCRRIAEALDLPYGLESIGTARPFIVLPDWVRKEVNDFDGGRYPNEYYE